MWDTEQWGMGVWVIAKGSPYRDAAYKFFAFACSPQPQADLTHYVPHGPANTAAIALVDLAILPDLPSPPDHVADALRNDPAFWAEKGDELTQRFTV